MKEDRLLNELKELDELLEFLYNNRGHSSIANIAKSMNTNGDIISNRTITLINQSYVHEPTNGNYAITANGRIFWLKGGYEKEHERSNKIEELQATQILLNEKQTEINGKNLVVTERIFWANMVIALGTAISAIYYSFQLHDGEHLKPYPCIALPIAGLCIVSIGIWGVLHILKRKK